MKYFIIIANYWLSAVVLIGDTYVGKTCLLKRFVNDEFSHDVLGTSGIDFAIRNVHIGGEVIKLEICDTGNCILWSLAHIGEMKDVCVCVHSCFNVIIIRYCDCCDCMALHYVSVLILLMSY